jgi:hypothetical protein
MIRPGAPVIGYHSATAGGGPLPGRGAALAILRGAYPVAVTAAGGGMAVSVEVRPVGGPVGRLEAGVLWQAVPAAAVCPAEARLWAAALTAAAALADLAAKPLRDSGK